MTDRIRLPDRTAVIIGLRRAFPRVDYLVDYDIEMRRLRAMRQERRDRPRIPVLDHDIERTIQFLDGYSR